MFKLQVSLLSVAALVSVATAQTPVSWWGQCGGIGYTGPTVCQSGSSCNFQNDYYSQCIPGSTSTVPSQPTTTVSVPTSTSAGGSAPTGGVQPNYWFSFGDSYTQTGFTTDGAIPATGNPLGNPPYPGFTAVGGTNWIDLNTVQFNNSLILTYNYAYGGATIDANLVAPYTPTVLSMTDQVNQFLSTVANKPSSAPWTSGNSLFSFWIGINDIGNSYYQSGSRDAATGARNFLFINVPPVDRSPLMLSQAASAQALEKSVIDGYNSKLATRVANFKAQNAGVQTWIWDSNTAFGAILDDPKGNGFVDATSYGNTGDFWGNNYHPSSAAHSIFAKQIGQLLGNTVW
ncbi:hypothetical protein QCA50_005371 [Cerrena zonata]|uniref:CBM1 domain-containing protein n=1 Tax=Cerrena zonata TaxID=2478898 RepID=A0AAW0GQX8_9APHY